MDRLRRIFLSSQRGLHGAVFALITATVLSQILALFRDRLLAGTFGIGDALDVYYAAFRIPDLVFVSVASLFSGAVIIPFLSERIDDREYATALLSSLVRAFLGLMAVVLAIIFVLMPLLAPLLAPGFEANQYEHLVLFARILLLSPLLLGLSGIFAGATQAYRHFVLFSLTPVLYNIGIIGGIVLLVPRMGVLGVVWGVIVGALLHVGIQIPVMVKHTLLRKSARVPVGAIMRTSIPRTIALSLTQLQVIVLTAFASLFSAGSIATFQFAFNLQSIPLSLIGVSYSLAAFPLLSVLWARAAHDDFLRDVRRAEGHVIVWSLLLTGLFIVLREHIVSVVLGVGAVATGDIALIAGTLSFFALSLVPQGLTLLYTRAFYAARHTAIPLVAGFAGVAVALTIAFTFAFGSTLPVAILAIAFSAGSFTTMVILMIMFRVRIGELSFASLWLHSVVATLVCAGITVYLIALYARFFDMKTIAGEFTGGLFAGLGGLLLAIVYMYCVRVQPVCELAAAIVRKWRHLQ